MTGLERLSHSRSCPQCHAAPGELCRTRKGLDLNTPHARRVALVRADVEAEHGPQDMPAAAAPDVEAPVCPCPPSYVRDELHGHTEALCPFNVHGPALLAEQLEAGERPSCCDAELPERDPGARELCRLAGQLVHERSCSPDVARVLAEQLDAMRDRMSPSGELSLLLRRRVYELERYARGRDDRAAQRAAAVAAIAPEYTNSGQLDVLEQLAHQQPAAAAECPRCGQANVYGGAVICDACRQLDREPQGAAVTLFDPAPYGAPIPAPAGQEAMF